MAIYVAGGNHCIWKLLKACHSPQVKQSVVSEFKNSVIDAW